VGGFVLLARLLGNEGPQFINIEGGLKVLVFIHPENAHAFFAEVAGVELVHQDPVVVLAAGVAAAAGVFPVLAHTTVTVRHVAPHLARLFHRGRLKLSTLPLNIFYLFIKRRLKIISLIRRKLILFI